MTSPACIFRASATATLLASLALFALPAAAQLSPTLCTAETRGITTFSCDSWPTKWILGNAPTFSCYTGATIPTCSAPRTAYSCGQGACVCPSGTYCTGSNTCVVPVSCPAGQSVVDVCVSNTCSTPNVLRSPAAAQSNSWFNVSGSVNPTTGTPTAGSTYFNTADNNFRFYNGTAWTPIIGSQWVNGASGVIYYNGGNVGIGTSSMSSNTKLTVYGSGSGDNLTQLKVTGGISSAVSTVVRSENTFGYVGTQSNHQLRLGTFDGTGGGIVINTDGNVGIGSYAPSANLEVYGANMTQIKVTNALDAGLALKAENTYGWLGTQTNHDLHLGTNGLASQMILNTSGNVGIGTSAPDSKVQVYGSGVTQLKVTGGTSSAVGTVVLSENTYGWIGTQTNHGLHIGTGYNSKMFITAAGNIGIGTSSPNYKLDVNGSIRTDSSLLAADIDVSTDGSAQIIIQNTDDRGDGVLYLSRGTADKDQAGIYFGENNNRGRFYQGLVYNCGSTYNNFVISTQDYVNDCDFTHTPEFLMTSSGNVTMSRVTARNGLTLDDGQLQVYQSEGGSISAAWIENTSTSPNGVVIQFSGVAVPTTSHNYISFRDGDYTTIDTIEGDGANGVRFTGTAAGTYSDRRLKTNIAAYEGDALDLISKLKPVTFNYRAGSNPDLTRIGFVAQEIVELFPQAINFGDELPANPDDWPILKLDYGELTPVLAKGIQQQQELISAQSARIDYLEARIEALESK